MVADSVVDEGAEQIPHLQRTRRIAYREAAFRDPFRERRCLVLVDGFYEWPKKPSPTSAHDGSATTTAGFFTLAGLWDRWRDPITGIRVESCTIVTTKANELLESVPHDRMPVVLEGDERELWLDVNVTDTDRVKDLLRSRETSGMESVTVSSEFVNHGVDDERCIEPVE